LERRAAAPGETIVRPGEGGADLYLIETGDADVQVIDRSGQRVTVAALGPGDCFGEIALVTGGERTADVVATTPMSLMRLGRDAYARYLAHLVEVERQIAHTAAVRAQQTLRTVAGREPKT
jgi:CRP-like cAMP-binding protein